MPEKKQIRAFVESYVTAVGRQDLDATLALFAADAVQEDPVGTPPNVGRQEIRGFFEKAYQTTFTTELTGPLLVTGDHAAFHFTIRIPLGEDEMVVRVIDQIRVGGDGLIAELRAVVE